jgi:hypothetical protein
LAPDQAPEATHAPALIADQCKVEVASLAIVLGLALKLTVGAGDLTATVADCDALPPVPLQVSVNVVLAFSSPVDCEPFVALEPDQAPEAEHEVAWVDDQFSVALPPAATALGPTLKLTVGAGAVTETVVDCAALPPAPVHLKV